MQLPRLEHDRPIERLVSPAIAFANEDAQQNGFAGEGHIRRTG
jgi:hypothetical protein